MAENDQSDIVAQKFCRLSTGDNPKKKQKCISVFKELIDADPDKLLEELQKLTGKSPEELTQIMLRSCPSCED